MTTNDRILHLAQSDDPNSNNKIVEIIAWVATTPGGGEGILGIITEGGMSMPLVGADRERIESFRDHAMRIHLSTGLSVRLIRFSSREVIEDLPS